MAIFNSYVKLPEGTVVIFPKAMDFFFLGHELGSSGSLGETAFMNHGRHRTLRNSVFVQQTMKTASSDEASRTA